MDEINNMEPDSLILTHASSEDKEDEIVQAFENEEDVELVDRATSVDMSRASVDSQRSISFFVDLKDENLMAHSMMVTPRPTSGRRTRSQQGERLTQSMYVRSDSQSSGVSFFVDISDKKMVHSMSREEADHDLDELSEDMRIKSSLLLAQNLEQTKAFFSKLKTYVDFLSNPSYSKDELRQKRKMAEKISRLMFEEEQKLKKGQSLSSMAELDKMLLGGANINKKPAARPVSAYCSSQLQQPGGSQDKPVLRRERTFDLDPKINRDKTKLVEVNIDTEDDLENNAADGQTLQMFQQQRLYHTMRLKREIAKLEKMEQDIAQKASEIGPDSSKAKTPSRSLRNTPSQCWTPNHQYEPKIKTSFKDLHDQRLQSRPSSGTSWLIPDQRPSTSRGSQTNHSLFRQFYEKKDKAVCVRDRPQAFFIECKKSPGVQTQRPKSAVTTTNIIDLETESLPEEKNLQEALRRKRPDYIEKTRTREQEAKAKSFMAAKGSLSARSTPIKAIYAAGKQQSRIPSAVRKNNSGTTSNAKKISMTGKHTLKAVQ